MSADWDPRVRFANAKLETESVRVGPGVSGLGVFAKRPILEGETILTFHGQEISFEEAVARGPWEGHTLQVGPTSYLDLEPPGVYANHSCNPNSGIQDNRLVALRAIRAGEEIVWDYSTSMAEDWFEMDCHCGAPNCRHRIRDFRHLPPDVQEFYLSRGMVQWFIRSGQSRLQSRTSDPRQAPHARRENRPADSPRK